MHVPGLMQRVRRRGLEDVYLVIRVDHDAQAADLVPIVYGRRAVKSVPFKALEPIPGCPAPKLRPDHVE
jgi:hypothetical protein